MPSFLNIWNFKRKNIVNILSHIFFLVNSINELATLLLNIIQLVRFVCVCCA